MEFMTIIIKIAIFSLTIQKLDALFKIDGNNCINKFLAKILKLEKSILISSVIKKMVKLWQVNLY